MVMAVKEQIWREAERLGFDACGFTTADRPRRGVEMERWLAEGCHGEMAYLARNAAKRLDLTKVLPGARSVVVVAASYASEGEATERRGGGGLCGVVARYARHRDYHEVMGDRLRALSGYMTELADGRGRSLWYVDTGPVLERELAERAGVGFVGKHTNLISRRLGNWFLLGEIITTLDLEPDEPEKNRCGSCVRCVEACPTGAITAPFRLDARRCISYLTIELKGAIPVELRPSLGTRIFGCDDCLAACPWNRFAREGRLMRAEARRDLVFPELIGLLGLDEAGFRERFRQTPLMRVKRRGLLRNVCVALGNSGERAAWGALERAAGDADPLIAEHARWALGRLAAGPGLPNR